jgi:putative salt-induced outer membrane protein YdiY
LPTRRLPPLLLAAALSAPGFAAPAPDEDEGWQHEVALGYDLNRGNSDTDAFRFGAKSGRKTARDEVLAEAQYNYGETDDLKSVENARAVADYNLLLSPRWYTNVKAEYSYDDVADVVYRVLVGPPGLGHYFIRRERTGLTGEFGVAYLWEKVGGVSRDAPLLRLKQRLDHRLNHAVTLFELVEWTPELEAGNRHLLRAEAGVDSALTRLAHLRVYVLNRYDSRPAQDAAKNDLSFNIALVLKT